MVVAGRRAGVGAMVVGRGHRARRTAYRRLRLPRSFKGADDDGPAGRNQAGTAFERSHRAGAGDRFGAAGRRGACAARPDAHRPRRIYGWRTMTASHLLLTGTVAL